MLQFIDTHCHLYGEEYADDVKETLSRAQVAGATKLFFPNINANTVEPILRLSSQHPHFLYPMLGIHPEEIKEDWQSALSNMEQHLQDPNHPFIAIGEVGLDFYWDKTYYNEQIEAFHVQISWAEKYHLPIMIHTRAAHQEIVQCLSGHNIAGVFHCFSGSAEIARELLAKFPNFALGIGGILTFKNSHLAATLQAEVPLERIVLETDAPYLAPTPYRGQRNESAYILEVLHKLSEIYNVSEEIIGEITTQNVLKIFPKAS